MAKISSYQKLKNKNLQLRRDIRNIIRNPDGVYTAIVISKHKIGLDLEDAVMAGSLNKEK